MAVMAMYAGKTMMMVMMTTAMTAMFLAVHGYVDADPADGPCDDDGEDRRNSDSDGERMW